MNLKFNFIVVLIVVSSCSPVNKTTSRIGKLNTTCLKEGAMDSLIARYNIANIDDDEYKYFIDDFARQPFECDLLYFTEGPKELIGVSTNHLRYGMCIIKTLLMMC